MELNVIAIDIAKKVFQLHWVELETGSIERLKLKRAQLLGWFANRQAALVVMEACGGAHEWGRELVKLGHEVRLLPPKMVRPFVQRNKTDAADAQAIWTAARQPGVRFVALKSEAQQVVLALHRVRALLMKTRIMQTNEVRGLLYEFGIVLPEGHSALMKELAAALRLAQGQGIHLRGRCGPPDRSGGPHGSDCPRPQRVVRLSGRRKDPGDRNPSHTQAWHQGAVHVSDVSGQRSCSFPGSAR